MVMLEEKQGGDKHKSQDCLCREQGVGSERHHVTLKVLAVNPGAGNLCCLITDVYK